MPAPASLEIGSLRVAVATISLLGACGPSADPPPNDAAARYGSAICSALESCGCYSEYSELPDCEVEYEERMTVFLEADLAFDGECFESVIESATLDECQLASKVQFLDCTLFRARKGEGEACAAHYGEVPPFGVDECDDDLICRAGYCRMPEDVLPPAMLGDPCDPTDIAVACPPGPNGPLDCGADGRCRAEAGLGETCLGPRACDSSENTLHCQGFGREGVGTCRPKGRLGDACDAADHSPCEWDPVTRGNYCSAETGVCVPDAPRVCVIPRQTYR